MSSTSPSPRLAHNFADIPPDELQAIIDEAVTEVRKETAHPSSTPRTTECNAQAGDKRLTGDARRQFMSECLKGQATKHEETSGTKKSSQSAASTDGKHHTAQGEKMKVCNQEASAKSLHGDERKTFMSACLKGEKKS